ncbi:MAG TPA: hypothetical protein VF147_00190, partial [Vicinamibacterales bacterium]
PHEFLSIRHLGSVKDGIEDTTSDAWAFAYENYTFSERDGGTELRVDQDVVAEYEDYLATKWPNALARLKALCENKT